MPGWRHPGLLEDPIAPSITQWNRGSFDAQGLPYAFHIEGLSGGSEIVRRVLRTNGQSGLAVDYFIRTMREQFGDAGEEQAYRFLNDQFCWSRNTTYSTPSPFWSRSPQSHPLWASQSWVLTCNSATPPGRDDDQPPDYPRANGRPWPSAGDDLRRWSVYPRAAPFYLGGVPGPNVLPYPLYQTSDAGQAEELPADVYRSPQPVFPEIMLEGLTVGNYGQQIFARPINV